ncbi:MAG: TIGR00730 family Rossman fold protein [Bauldia sp.]|nr:TIGR00730 family Rossman fold protein [Bauldia sp.]
MTENHAQKAAASFRLPAVDVDYILGDSMRGVRFLLEYAKAEEHLRAWGVRSTVVVFGSARAMPRGGADPDAARAPLPADTRPLPGRRPARWYEEARRFGRIVSERGGALRPTAEGIRDNVIATGGGPGIMEAANRGASDARAPSIGFNIQVPHEQEPNAYSTPDLTFQFHYFAMRKMHLAMRAAALVVFPGGFGTFDELFEILTLVTTGKMRAVPIVCFDRGYWERVINFKALAEEGMISPGALGVFSYADDAEEAWATLVKAGLTIPPERGAEPRSDVAP